MRILVTGANGHIGSNLVRELIARNHDVVGLVRVGSNHEGLEGLAVKKVFGDVRDAQAVLDAARGCEIIIHLAAVYAWAGTLEEIVEPAVQGIDHVLKAAKEVGCTRVIHTSSIVAVGFSESPVIRGPDDWNHHSDEPYIIAKMKSEKVAWQKAEELDVPLVVINPSGIIGRHDYKITPSNGFVLDIIHGRGTRFKGGLNYVDVRDVAQIHADAVTRGVAGQRYIVAGPNLSVSEFADAVCNRAGSRAPSLGLPRWMMLPLAGMLEKIQGPNGQVKRGLVEEFYQRWMWYDTSKTEEDFGWKPKDTDEMLDDSLAWYLARDLIQAKPADKLKETIKERDFSVA